MGIPTLTAKEGQGANMIVIKKKEVKGRREQTNFF
jgi:hypothetical protein